MMVQPRATAATPLPPGRGRWRFTLHNRQFVNLGQPPSATGVAELVDARSRRLEQQLNAPAQLSFTMDGRAQAALAVRELQQDVIAWRWSENAGADLPLFHGPITQAQDQVGDKHVVNFVCHDYLAVLSRRFITSPTPLIYTQVDQDDIVGGLLGWGRVPQTGNGTTLTPGGYLPLQAAGYNPDGTARTAKSGQLRDRSYLGNQEILEAIANLADSLPVAPAPGQVNSFDYDAAPVYVNVQGFSDLRVFYPVQGVTRTDLALVYGAAGVGGLASVSRTVNSADYANYIRILGNNGNSDQTAAQLYADVWNADATTGSLGAVGTWMSAENESDVNQPATLQERARGRLASDGILVPSYSLGLAAGAYRAGYPNMGDTVPLIVQSGRLNVNTTVRVLGIAYAIGDDGQEDVELTVGRPAVTLAQILRDARTDINALARR